MKRYFNHRMNWFRIISDNVKEIFVFPSMKTSDGPRMSVTSAWSNNRHILNCYDAGCPGPRFQFSSSPVLCWKCRVLLPVFVCFPVFHHASPTSCICSLRVLCGFWFAFNIFPWPAFCRLHAGCWMCEDGVGMETSETFHRIINWRKKNVVRLFNF